MWPAYVRLFAASVSFYNINTKALNVATLGIVSCNDMSKLDSFSLVNIITFSNKMRQLMSGWLK
jgi:hypothetical protein